MFDMDIADMDMVDIDMVDMDMVDMDIDIVDLYIIFHLGSSDHHMVNFYLTPFGGRVYYKWKFCPSVCLFVCLSVITSYFTDISVSVAQMKKIQNTR